MGDYIRHYFQISMMLCVVLVSLFRFDVNLYEVHFNLRDKAVKIIQLRALSHLCVPSVCMLNLN